MTTLKSVENDRKERPLMLRPFLLEAMFQPPFQEEAAQSSGSRRFGQRPNARISPWVSSPHYRGSLARGGQGRLSDL